MKKLLIVVDMQNDFISGALGTPEAESIVPKVKTKIEAYSGDDIIFTRDTHGADYLGTQEGAFLPVPHCIEGTPGHEIADGLLPNRDGISEPADSLFTNRDDDGEPADGSASRRNGIVSVLDKPCFGSLELAEAAAKGCYGEIELCGLCTDICVVSNALILKARLPETKISVDASCCAGVTKESHAAALLTMRMCQVNVING